LASEKQIFHCRRSKCRQIECAHQHNSTALHPGAAFVCLFSRVFIACCERTELTFRNLFFSFSFLNIPPLWLENKIKLPPAAPLSHTHTQHTLAHGGGSAAAKPLHLNAQTTRGGFNFPSACAAGIQLGAPKTTLACQFTTF
jgi:hypothetical protein